MGIGSDAPTQIVASRRVTARKISSAFPLRNLHEGGNRINRRASARMMSDSSNAPLANTSHPMRQQLSGYWDVALYQGQAYA